MPATAANGWHLCRSSPGSPTTQGIKSRHLGLPGFSPNVMGSHGKMVDAWVSSSCLEMPSLASGQGQGVPGSLAPEFAALGLPDCAARSSSWECCVHDGVPMGAAMLVFEARGLPPFPAVQNLSTVLLWCVHGGRSSTSQCQCHEGGGAHPGCAAAGKTPGYAAVSASCWGEGPAPASGLWLLAAASTSLLFATGSVLSLPLVASPLLPRLLLFVLPRGAHRVRPSARTSRCGACRVTAGLGTVADCPGAVRWLQVAGEAVCRVPVSLGLPCACVQRCGYAGVLRCRSLPRGERGRGARKHVRSHSYWPLPSWV